MNVAAEKYVRLTTFTKDGRPKHTPVWIAAADNGGVATTTDDDSWKVKRIRNTKRVELVASDGKGNVEEPATPIVGQATIIDHHDPEFEQIESAFISKYGLMYKIFRLIRRIRGKTPCGITIMLEPDQASSL
jgi:hypothetical protein